MSENEVIDKDKQRRCAENSFLIIAETAYKALSTSKHLNWIAYASKIAGTKGRGWVFVQMG